jgi:mRNA interferase YafQ
MSQLALDKALLAKNRAQALGGESKDHGDCHVKPDLVLIDRKPNPDVLQLGPAQPTLGTVAR